MPAPRTSVVANEVATKAQLRKHALGGFYNVGYMVKEIGKI